MYTNIKTKSYIQYQLLSARRQQRRCSPKQRENSLGLAMLKHSCWLCPLFFHSCPLDVRRKKTEIRRTYGGDSVIFSRNNKNSFRLLNSERSGAKKSKSRESKSDNKTQHNFNSSSSSSSSSSTQCGRLRLLVLPQRHRNSSVWNVRSKSLQSVRKSSVNSKSRQPSFVLS